MARSKGRSGRPWQRLRAQVIAESTHCHLCGQWLDKTARNPHPRSVVIDHIISLIEGGHPTDRANLAAACHECNRMKEEQRRRQRSNNTSRDW